MTNELVQLHATALGALSSGDARNIRPALQAVADGLQRVIDQREAGAADLVIRAILAYDTAMSGRVGTLADRITAMQAALEAVGVI